MSRKNAAKKTAAVVYCGPTVRGVAKQYTAYRDSPPAAVCELGEKYPEIRRLTVPLERFAATRRALQRPDSAESLLYARLCKKLRDEMKNKEE